MEAVTGPHPAPTDLRSEDARRRDKAFVRYVATLVHRVLAQHRPYERCDECPPKSSPTS